METMVFHSLELLLVQGHELQFLQSMSCVHWRNSYVNSEQVGAFPLYGVIKEAKTDCPTSLIILTLAGKCYNMNRGLITINGVMSEKDLKIIIKNPTKQKHRRFERN